MITFTEQDALNGLRQAVSARGANYTYPQGRCIYVADVDGTLEPRCMVGYALACMGVPLRLIHESPANATTFPTLASFLSFHGYHFTPGATIALRAAQAVQDRGSAVLCECPSCVRLEARGGNTWGNALAEAVAVTRQTATTSIDAVVVNAVAVTTTETSIDTAVKDVIASAEALTTSAAELVAV